jgi:hypothetical protein
VDARIEAISSHYVPDTAEARNRELRQRLTRRLLDDPTPRSPCTPYQVVLHFA